MEDDAGLREGIRKIPRRRKAPSKIQVEDDGENSPVLKNSAEAELGRSDDIESGEGGLLGRERRKDKDGVGSELDSVDGTRESLIKREEAKRDDIAKKEDPKVETIRVDPVKEFFARQRRLDKMSSTDLPEMHVVGQIKSCTGLLLQDREGACCRWKVEHDKAWQHLGGELSGQTQIAYCKYVCSELVQLNHPIDLHFAEAGLHGWGAPRISFQAFRMDVYGRRVLAGYGFAHIPLRPGLHNIEVSLWRPSGSPEQELEAFFLGNSPALVSAEPIYESAWKERCRLVTCSSGSVLLELFVVSRYSSKHGIDL